MIAVPKTSEVVCMVLVFTSACCLVVGLVVWAVATWDSDDECNSLHIHKHSHSTE